MSRRIQDMRAESQLALFLDEKFWGRILDGTGWSFKRVLDASLQLQGVDVILQGPGGRVRYVDEKAQLYYINNTLPTFAFEIDSFQGGVLRQGWLLDDSLLTTDYHLIYPNAKHDNLSVITKDDFTSVEIISIHKTTLLQELAKTGLTREYLLSESKRIRDIAGRGMYREQSICPYVKFVKSDSSRYTEAPLNIVVQNSFLRRVAHKVFEVTSGGLK